MKLLKITETDNFEEFDELFDEIEDVDIEQVSPSVVEEGIDVRINGGSIKDYDAAFLEIPRKNAVFGRVLLEIMEENDLSLNYYSTSFFTMAKKNYLYYVLHEKNIDAPKTASIASEKAARNLGNDLEFPVIGREFNNMEETETSLLENMEDAREFAEGVEYGEEFILFREKVEGEKYRCFVTENTFISLKDNSDNWEVGTENLNYSNPGKDVEEKVKEVRNVLGTEVAEVIVKGSKIIDVNPNPDLKKYTNISGKNAYEAVAEALKSDEK